MCQHCTKEFTVKEKQCVACGKKCSEKDIIDMKVEGTGFVSGGQVQVVKYDVAFQG